MTSPTDTLASLTTANIVAALAQAQAAFGRAAKDSANDHFRTKYVSLSAALDAVLPALNANGLALTQHTYVADSGVVMLRTVLWHVSGEWLAADYPLMPAKADPQGYGSAMTYARRYCLMALTGIAPADDDDGTAASFARDDRSRGKQRRGVAHVPPGSIGPGDRPAPMIVGASIDDAIAHWSDQIDAAASVADLEAVADLLKLAPAAIRLDKHLRARYGDRFAALRDIDHDRADLDALDHREAMP